MKMNFSLLQNQEYNKIIYIDKIHENEVEALGFMKMGREAKIHEKIKFRPCLVGRKFYVFCIQTFRKQGKRV